MSKDDSLDKSLVKRLEAQGIEIDESLLFEGEDGLGSPNREQRDSEDSCDTTKDDETTVFDDLDLDEFDVFDEFGRTPPRTRLSKNRKWKNNKKHMNELAHSSDVKHSTGQRRVSLDSPKRRKSNKVVSFPAGLDWTTESENIRSQYEQRKRATHLSRDHDRSEKFDLGTGPSSVHHHSSFSSASSYVIPPHLTPLSFVSTGTTSSVVTAGLNSPIGDPQSPVDPYGSLVHADSLPVAMSPLPCALKVETTNRFSSLMSKPVYPTNQELTTSNSGFQTPQKRSSVSGTDRQTFYKVFTAMLKSNQLSASESKWDRSDMLGKSSKRSKGSSSHLELTEDMTLYESKTNDVIWLELQAWFADQLPEEYDRKLVEMRKSVKGTIEDILKFKFVTNFDEEEEMRTRRVTEREVSVLSDASDVADSSTSSERFYDAQESLSHSLNDKTTFDSEGTLKSFEKDGVALCLEEEENNWTVPWSLDVFDRERVTVMNRALDQVYGLLQQLDVAEQYYASSKMFRTDHPVLGNPSFQSRVKCLCMWYNLTRQLRSKIDVLGHVLFGTSYGQVSRFLPWPRWDQGDDSLRSIHSDESGIMSPMSASMCGTLEVPTALTPIHSRDSSLMDIDSLNASTGAAAISKVRFRIDEDEVSSTNPSDSNNSTSTDSGSASGATNLRPPVLPPPAPPLPVPVPGKTPSRQFLTMSSILTDVSSAGDIENVELFRESPYRKFVDRHLKIKGLRKTMSWLQTLIRGPLRRARMALEKPLSIMSSSSSNSLSTHIDDVTGGALGGFHQPMPEERFSSHPVPSEDEKELTNYGTWNTEFRKMNLPSFRAPYLFLCKVPLDVIHECLVIRLKQKPQEPSELSIRQLMRECKEVLRLAVIERQKYISRVKVAVHPERDREFVEKYERDMAEFDAKLTETLEVYLTYLSTFVAMIQSDSSLLISTYQKSLLEEEWHFIKQICPHIPEGEIFSCNTFCLLACGMLKAIGNFLNSELDGVVSKMFVDPDSDDSDEETQLRHQVYEACRGFQAVFGEARERALKALAFAKTLRKDLEVAAEFAISGSVENFVERLMESGHIRVQAAHFPNRQIFVPGNIRERRDVIVQLLDMHCGSDQPAMKSEASLGYLILLNSETDAFSWNGPTIDVRANADTTISLSQIEFKDVLMVATGASFLSHRRRDFMTKMRDVLTLVHDQRATSHKIALSLEQVKQEALKLRETITQELSMVQDKCDVSELGCLDPNDVEALSRRTREILHQCYKFGFEFHKELDRLVTGQKGRSNLAHGVIDFSHQWMKFVEDRCDRGKGSKPRWAMHGIDFLYFAAGPNFTKHLTNDEFNRFKSKVEHCYNYVIGEPSSSGSSKSATSPTTGEGTLPRPSSAPNRRSGSRSRPSSPNSSNRSKPQRAISDVANPNPEEDKDKLAKLTMPPPNSPFVRRSKKSSTVDEPDTPDTAGKAPPYGLLPWKERVPKKVEELEKQMDRRRYEDGFIGTVLDHCRREDRIHIKSKTVNFSWQRGVKIGQGHFGKVYTAINNETGDIMAMKEIALQPNDHKTLRNVADELRIFENIRHKNLIKHYGVEVHREEMLIFMEYCPEGTLEELVSTTETGLEESSIRRYARQLLDAVATLHDNGIVHRDIKGANIFLTDEMQTLKLGDFGCAVKIKAHTTMPGELQGFVGTQAYMAPEVFTKNMSEGHGRAADIWSVGCVIIEMSTGKRPWHELESNYQIMFKVGMGESPPIPYRLSKEGQEFLSCCFEHDPRARATAHDLLNEPFLKVYEEEENQSLPMFQSLADLGADFKKLNLVRKTSNY